MTIRTQRKRSCFPLSTKLFSAAILAVGLSVPAAQPAQAQAVSGGSVSVGSTQSKSDRPSDQRIADAVENEILYDPAVPLTSMDVTVAEGIVTLNGTVSNLLAKDRAAKLATTVRGVRSVVNHLNVEPSVMRTDTEIAQQVEQALLADPATESYEVSTVVSNGEVTLEGTVESWPERQLAERVAKGVIGVKKVVNEIDVSYAEARTDREITADIRGQLRADALVDSGLVRVNTNNGVVTLTGTVGSAAEKNRAIANAYVTGTMDVKSSDLKVRAWADGPMQRTGAAPRPSDQEIREAVNDALLYDPRVASFNVKPEVDMGAVILRGTVDSLSAKKAAERDARNTIGVLAVDNRIKVRTDDRPDDMIAKSVRQSIKRNPYTERHEITTTVVNGHVYLSGTVDSSFEKQQAENLARNANGALAVHNYLTVRDPEYLVYDPIVSEVYWFDQDLTRGEVDGTTMTDSEIREEIRDELWWSPFVDSDQVNVTVEEGVARLTGTVDSWAERNAATENAIEGGAVWVDNDLMIANAN